MKEKNPKMKIDTKKRPPGSGTSRLDAATVRGMGLPATSGALARLERKTKKWLGERKQAK